MQRSQGSSIDGTQRWYSIASTKKLAQESSLTDVTSAFRRPKRVAVMLADLPLAKSKNLPQNGLVFLSFVQVA